MKGKITLLKTKTGLVRIGFGSIKLLDYSFNRTILHIDGEIVISGKCKIGQGSRIEVAKTGQLNIGENFIVSGQSKIICHKNITIGANSLFAWDSLIMDTDYHKIYNDSKEQLNKDQNIVIGNHVWIGTRTTILKASIIPSGCIIAANSVISNKFYTKNCILAGNPAKEVKKNISWE